VLFSQRDLLEARISLIETKQQQLAAIISAYQALGGGYLLTTAGLEFSELFCQPGLEIHPYEDVPAPLPVQTIEPSLTEPVAPPGPGVESLPPPAPKTT
jgi:hypothetical protein